jgi:hypothetical protein
MDREQFRNPPAAFKPVPFWSWNDDLQDEELIRQIAEMDAAGWGGFFMHSRVGLVTPYLSEAWMDRVRTCVAEAKRRGLGAWIYDEDKWPSGYAGGYTTAPNPEHRGRILICQVDTKPALIGERLAAFIARREVSGLVDFRPYLPGQRADWGRETLVQFYPLTLSLGSAWFNGYTYLDTLNPEAVRSFIASTYEAYARAVGQEFGRVVPGVFTDEPCALPHHIVATEGRRVLPWTSALPGVFRERKGYDLLSRLPALFFDTPGGAKVRYDFWDVVQDLFVTAWSKLIYEWCEAHHIAYTGHYMAEDGLAYQMDWTGGVMPHYEYQHIPGIDKLARHVDQPITVKQVDSVACQLGKPRVLSEMYGCTGQDLSFETRKWIGDEQYALGINLLNPHLALYSMRGERKRDHPANIFYQQPWWPYNRKVDDYFARLSYALTQGRRVVDILVIHPMETAWTLYRPRETYALRAYDRWLQNLNDDLLALHRDYHFGDEKLMARHARVEGNRIWVGQMPYRAVIVPPAKTLRRTTVQLLQAFAAAGGIIIAQRPVPDMLEGVPAADLLPPTTRIVESGRDALKAALDTALPPNLRLTAGAEEVLYHHRRADDADIVFLCNTSLEREITATVEFAGEGALEEWEVTTGDVLPLAARTGQGHTSVTLTFPPTGSHLLVLRRDSPGARSSGKASQEVLDVGPDYVVHLDGPWAFHRLDPNSFTLDYCAYRLGDDPWSDPLPVWKVQQALRQAGTGAPFTVRYTFTVEQVPVHRSELILEAPEKYVVRVNGQDVPPADSGHWRDISFRRLDITGRLQEGMNQIELSGVFADDTELESVYLIGDFGVSARCLRFEGSCNGQTFNAFDRRFAVVGERATLSPGDFSAQGYPFFAGAISLVSEFELPPEEVRRGLLRLRGLHAIVAAITLNGREVGQIFWRPHELDLKDALRPGHNRLEVKLVSSLRNLLGPHHLRGGDGLWTGPGEFRDEGRWIDDYVLVPFGLSGVDVAVWHSSKSV